jgi:hypothetical protein
MATAAPKGIGTDAEAAQATAFMREQPWYRSLFTSWGVNPDDPGNFHLNDDQQEQLLNVAHDNGLGISDSYEIDRNGAIREKSHKLRNTLIGAGIAGSMFIPGVGPAVLSGLSAAGHGIAAGATALGHGAATLGSKAASFLGFGSHAADPMAATLSAEGNSPWLAGAGELAGETGEAADGIPAAFGWNAVDTVGSAAPSAASTAAGGTAMAAGSKTASSGLFERLASKYGVDVAKGVVGGLFSNAQNNKRLNLENSMSDPYRGQLFQSRDVAKLDQMATGELHGVADEHRRALRAPLSSPSRHPGRRATRCDRWPAPTRRASPARAGPVSPRRRHACRRPTCGCRRRLCCCAALMARQRGSAPMLRAPPDAAQSPWLA